jgi:hypothetical protein
MAGARLEDGLKVAAPDSICDDAKLAGLHRAILCIFILYKLNIPVSRLSSHLFVDISKELASGMLDRRNSIR